MFKSPEHCLTVCFAVIERRIEPKNATQVVVESMRANSGAHADTRTPTGMTPHDWHAQAAMALQFVRRELEAHPLLWDAIVAEYSTGVPGALAVQAIANYLVPDLDGTERLLTDMLVMRLFRGMPALRDMEQHFGVPKSTLHRREREHTDAVRTLREQAMDRLRGPMQECGLLGQMSLAAVGQG